NKLSRKTRPITKLIILSFFEFLLSIKYKIKIIIVKVPINKRGDPLKVFFIKRADILLAIEETGLSLKPSLIVCSANLLLDKFIQVGKVTTALISPLISELITKSIICWMNILLSLKLLMVSPQQAITMKIRLLHTI